MGAEAMKLQRTSPERQAQNVAEARLMFPQSTPWISPKLASKRSASRKLRTVRADVWVEAIAIVNVVLDAERDDTVIQRLQTVKDRLHAAAEKGA